MHEVCMSAYKHNICKGEWVGLGVFYGFVQGS